MDYDRLESFRVSNSLDPILSSNCLQSLSEGATRKKIVKKMVVCNWNIKKRLWCMSIGHVSVIYIYGL